MKKVNHKQKEPVQLIDIMDKVADAKQQGIIAERYLFGFSKSWDHGYISTDMIDEEIGIVADIVVHLNSDLEDAIKKLDVYKEVSNGQSA